jgi:hypothetical protein
MTAAPTSPSAAAQPGASQAASPPAGIDDALVQQIADRIYQRLLQEMQVEHERLRLVSKRTLASRFRKGGR